MHAILPASMHGANKHSWTRHLCSAKGAASLKAWGTAPRNAKRRRNQRAESALQLASQFHRSLALNRAFSANTHLDDAKALAVPQATGDMRFIGNPLQKDCLCHTA